MPTDAGPAGGWYCFKHGARKDTGGEGQADVGKRGCFAWEYKGKHANLDAKVILGREFSLPVDGTVSRPRPRRPPDDRIEQLFPETNEWCFGDCFEGLARR